MNDKEVIKKYVNKLHELNTEFNKELEDSEQYERIGDETTSCWLENMINEVKKSEVVK